MDATEYTKLEILSKLFPTIEAVTTEIVNLSAILNLPKGTEHFASDIHGEYEAFSHVLRNGSGSIRAKIEEVFGDELTDAEKREFATLIYYPHEKMDLILPNVTDRRAWYTTTIRRLITMADYAARKYSRSKLHRMLPDDFAYIIEELMTEKDTHADREEYVNAIIDAVIEIDSAEPLIQRLCELIWHLVVEHLHVLGDIYDRGPYPHTIMDALIRHHSVDIQWGNHDIIWMAAALGQRGAIATVVRNCARYGNLDILSDAYGINMLPVANFAMRAYADDPCAAFGLKGNPDLSPYEHEMNVKIQKAMSILQFKVEAQAIDENPSFGLNDRKLLEHVDYENGTVTVDGVAYPLTDPVFPTVDPANPNALTPEEEDVMRRLEESFLNCEKLQRHIRFMLDAGSLYKVFNNNLLLHGCVPLNPDGSLMEVELFGYTYKGKALFDVLDSYVRKAFDSADPIARKRGRDLMWYMWLGPGSPLFAKSKMATFERYVLAEKEPRKEEKNSFYKLVDCPEVFDGIFEDFGMDPQTAHVICGHVPVKVKDGENPVKANGKLICIDGGFSKAYQPTTGIAGYTLISNSYGLVLAAHEPLPSKQAAIEDEIDIHSEMRVVDHIEKRTLVADTDTGAVLKRQIASLKRLLAAYRAGDIPERR